MFTLKDLTAEIKALVLDKLNAEVAIHPDFVTAEIMGNHQDIDGEDADFYRCVAYPQVRHEVGNCILRLKLTPEAALNPQSEFTMPGFARLQKAYLVDHDGVKMAIPLTQMTREQRAEKVNELRAMGLGCFQHADELERFDLQYPAAA